MPDLKKQPKKTNSKSLGIPSFFERLKNECKRIEKKPFPIAPEKVERMPPWQLKDIENALLTQCDQTGVETIWGKIQPHLDKLNPEDVKKILYFALESGNPLSFECVLKTDKELLKQILEEYRAENKLSRIEEMLFNSAKAGNVVGVNFLVDNGVDVDFKDSEREETALIYAVRNNNLGVIEILYKAGADMNARDKSGATPIMRAITLGETGIYTIALLLANGADVNAKSNDGLTPLMLACNNRKIAKLLLDNGADITAKSGKRWNSDGWNALIFAVENDCKEVVNLLIKEAKKIFAKNKTGFKAFLNYKADDGITALKQATIREHTEIEILLKKQGATK